MAGHVAPHHGDDASVTLSAGVVVLRRGSDGCRYLLLRVYGYWDFPKGLVQENEDPLQAARREVEEETSLRKLHFRWGEEYRETSRYRRSKVARYYVAEANGGDVMLPVNPELGRPEHHEFRWLTYERARERLADRVKPILDWAHELAGCGSAHGI